MQYDGRTFQADDWLNYGSYYYVPQRFALTSKSNIEGAGLPVLTHGAVYNDNNQGAIKTLSDDSGEVAVATMPQEVMDAIVGGKELIIGGVARLGNLSRTQYIITAGSTAGSTYDGLFIRQSRGRNDGNDVFQISRGGGSLAFAIDSDRIYR